MKNTMHDMKGRKIKKICSKQVTNVNRALSIVYHVSFIVGFLLIVFSTGGIYSYEKTVIMVIKSRNIAPYKSALMGFKDHLKRQILDARIIEFCLEEESGDDFANIREGFKSIRPDLVLTLGTPATRIAQETAKNIPVIFTMVLDPKKSNILPPGVLMDIPPEIKLSNIKSVFPRAKRIGLIYSVNSIPDYEEVLQVSGQFGFQLIGRKINSRKEFPEALSRLWRQIDCFLMIPDSKIFFPESVRYLLTEGLRNKIPIIGLSSSYTEAGALVSFYCNYEDLGEQAAEIALKILAGKNSAETKFVIPRRIDFSLNLFVAGKLEIKIPSEIIKAAREVFGR